MILRQDLDRESQSSALKDTSLGGGHVYSPLDSCWGAPVCQVPQEALVPASHSSPDPHGNPSGVGTFIFAILQM